MQHRAVALGLERRARTGAWLRGAASGGRGRRAACAEGRGAEQLRFPVTGVHGIGDSVVDAASRDRKWKTVGAGPGWGCSGLDALDELMGCEFRYRAIWVVQVPRTVTRIS